MDIGGLHHVSIVVTDLERARRFYSDILGLREIQRPRLNFPGAWYSFGEHQLHLIVHGGARTLRGTAVVDSRDGHFPFKSETMRKHAITC